MRTKPAAPAANPPAKASHKVGNPGERRGRSLAGERPGGGGKGGGGEPQGGQPGGTAAQLADEEKAEEDGKGREGFGEEICFEQELTRNEVVETGDENRQGHAAAGPEHPYIEEQ